MQQQSRWRAAQERAKDTVVQIFTNVAQFNWFEPYKPPVQNAAFGSGFFIDDQGTIATNFHVVHETIGLQVQIPSLGKERLDCTLLGVHPGADVALLRLTDEARAFVQEKLGKIPFLDLGDSDSVISTQEIIALGYPLGQQGIKVTEGIVSGREKINLRTYMQITAPLNPGNSGGPSLNLAGEVIGINFAGVLQAQSVGYLIPINEVKSAIVDLYNVPLLRRPYLGGIFSISNQDMVEYFMNPGQGGFYVAQVFPETTLEKAGVLEGDMIYEFNSYAVDRFGEVSVPWSEDRVSVFDLLGRSKVGDEVHLRIFRKGEELNIRFNLEQGRLLPIRYVYPLFEDVSYETIGGLVLMELTLNHVDQLAEANPMYIKYHRIEYQGEPRLLICNVLHNSQADRSRALGVGDMICEVNGEQVRSLEDFRHAIMKSKESGYVTIKTESQLYTVLSLSKILAEEDALVEQHFYEKSNLCDVLS